MTATSASTTNGSLPVFDNTFVSLGESFYKSLEPTPVPTPGLIRVNHGLAEDLGFDPMVLESEKGIAVLSGNGLFEGMEPLAAAYAGHQFGQFNPQLGDGRAVLLGEVLNKADQRFDIQLKGSGPTPYSRGGDGRAPLGPVLREYLVSEAMFALGVPTSRSLAAMSTGELVYREEPLHGAVLTRVASSHIRIGSFQFFAAKGMSDELKSLADYVIHRHYKSAIGADQPYLDLLDGVAQKQAELIATWQHLGFVHGVMNTDNVLLSGETIDYGPCAFLDVYKPDQVFSSIDRGGRYAYQNQPSIAHWNLMNLAQTLLPLINEDSDKAIAKAQEVVDKFPAYYEAAYATGLNRKLGLAVDCEKGLALGKTLLELLAENQCDFTLAFRRLAELYATHLGESMAMHSAFGDTVSALFEFPDTFSNWLDQWKQLLDEPAFLADDPSEIFRANPAFIPRNHLIEASILEGYQGNYASFENMLERVTNPFKYRSEDIRYATPPAPEEVVRQTFCGT